MGLTERLAVQFNTRACSDGRVVLGTAPDCLLCLTTAWVRIPALACEKVASDLGLGGG